MLGWAQRNLDAFHSSQEAFLRKGAYTLWLDHDVEVGEYLVHVAIDENIRPPDAWPFQIGDIIHNMRVSLDYLAFALAMKHNPAIVNDRKAAFQIAFPICEKPVDWGSLAGKVRQWAGAEAVAAFERLQPYQRPHLANYDPLLLLHKLDNPHKHRNLLAAAPVVTWLDYSATGEAIGFDITHMGLEGPFIDGAVVARGRFTQGCDLPAHATAAVNVQVACEVAFDEMGPAPRYPARELLNEIADLIRNVIFPPLEHLLK